MSDVEVWLVDTELRELRGGMEADLSSLSRRCCDTKALEVQMSLAREQVSRKAGGDQRDLHGAIPEDRGRPARIDIPSLLAASAGVVAVRGLLGDGDGDWQPSITALRDRVTDGLTSRLGGALCPCWGSFGCMTLRLV